MVVISYIDYFRKNNNIPLPNSLTGELLLSAAILLLIIAVSSVNFLCIEKPLNRFFRKLLNKKYAPFKIKKVASSLELAD